MTAWLPDVLRAAGLQVTTHGVRPRPGDYEPIAVLNHHTASAASTRRPAPSLALVQRGRPDLPGPLCQILIGWDGHCHVITTGRANHAGTARRSGPVPAGDGNELYIGIEIDYSGYVAPSPAQYAATVAANAAILTRLRRTAEYARGHRETSTTGKWDPGHVDLDQLRADIHTAMQQEDDMPLTNEEIVKVARAVLRQPLEHPDTRIKGQTVTSLLGDVFLTTRGIRSEVVQPDGDPAEIADQVIAALGDGLAKQVLDALAVRLTKES